MPKETIKERPNNAEGPGVVLEVAWGQAHGDTIQVMTRNTEAEDIHSPEAGWAIHLTETQSSELIRTLQRVHKRQFLSADPADD